MENCKFILLSKSIKIIQRHGDAKIVHKLLDYNKKLAISNDLHEVYRIYDRLSKLK